MLEARFGHRHHIAGKSRSARLSRCGANVSCLDSHRSGLDGIRLRRGAVWAVPDGVSVGPGRLRRSVSPVLPVVWNRADRRRHRRESIVGLEPHPPGRRAESRRHCTPTLHQTGRQCGRVSGSGRLGHGYLSHLDSRLLSMADNGIFDKPSAHSVDETVERLKSILLAKGVTLFALVDHSGEAEKAGMKMPPTKLLIFGNPKAGTPLMLAAPSTAIDLPLKILVWEDAQG